MHHFAALLDRLLLTPSRNGKLAALVDYFRETPDPDRGYGLAAVANTLDLKTVKPALLRGLAVSRIDAELFALSYDYVGDLAETIALIWGGDGEEEVPHLADVVERLQRSGRVEAEEVLRNLLDRLGPSERFAVLKLATGGLRVGVSARLAKQALADFGGIDVSEIEELWHGQAPPYAQLFAWLEGRGKKPRSEEPAPFRPVMLSTPLDAATLEQIEADDYAVEWKWDGIRVQAVSESGIRRLYSRTGDDISSAFPDIVDAITFDGALDGELLVARPGDGAVVIGSFAELQQRLNRKTVTKAMLADYPAFVRVYDLLIETGEDLRALPFFARRARLERLAVQFDAARFDLSPILPFPDREALAALRADPPHPVIEGLMLKRKDSAYVAGRPRGPWFKWKRDPYLIDAVLMYAQRGHGRRSGYYSDYTFGVWNDAGELVPVGKAYFGFTDAELLEIDRYVRDHTSDRFGPVRAVIATKEQGLVLEIAFEGLNRSTRHKSGLAMRFPRISRLRWDKPAGEADRLADLETLLDPA
jgi:DNA ligase-1